MADQSVNIKVGSSYDGSGMSRAMGGVNNLSRAAGKAASSVGKIGGAFESLGGTAGKTVGAISGALGALATGGVFGAIIFGVTAIVSWFQKMGDESKNVEKLKKSLDKIKESTDKYTASLSTSLTKIDKQMTAINNLSTAYQRLAKAEAMAQKAAITDKLEDMPEGADKIEATARANLDMTRIDAKEAKSVADSKVETADKKIEALNKKIENVDKTIELLNDDLDKYDKALLKAQKKLYARQERGASKNEIKVAKEEVEAAAKAKNEFVTKTYNPVVAQKNDLNRELDTAKVEKSAAEKERENVVAANTKKIDLAERALRQATAAAADAREAEALQSEQQLAEQKAYAYQQQRLTQVEEQLEKEKKKVKDAEEDYAKALKEAAKATAAAANANGLNYNFGGGGDAGGMGGDPNFVNTGINGQNRYGGYTPHYNADGTLTDRDQARLSRMQAGIARNAANAGGLSSADKRDYRDLIAKARRGTPLSDKELERLRDYENKDPDKKKEKADADATKAKDKLTEAQKQLVATQQILTLLQSLKTGN